MKDGLDLGRCEEGAQEPGVDPGPGGLAEVWRPRRVLRPRFPLHRKVNTALDSDWSVIVKLGSHWIIFRTGLDETRLDEILEELYTQVMIIPFPVKLS